MQWFKAAWAVSKPHRFDDSGKSVKWPLPPVCINMVARNGSVYLNLIIHGVTKRRHARHCLLGAG